MPHEGVLDFIHKRFQTDCNWMSGNCYWFAIILTHRFPQLILYYDPIEGHFYSVDLNSSIAYDYRGPHQLDPSFIRFNKLKVLDPVWYDRIIENCVL